MNDETKDAIDLLEKSCFPHAVCNRDHKLENIIVKRSRIELKLLMQALAKNYDAWNGKLVDDVDCASNRKLLSTVSVPVAPALSGHTATPMCKYVSVFFTSEASVKPGGGLGACRNCGKQANGLGDIVICDRVSSPVFYSPLIECAMKTKVTPCNDEHNFLKLFRNISTIESIIPTYVFHALLLSQIERGENDICEERIIEKLNVILLDDSDMYDTKPFTGGRHGWKCHADMIIPKDSCHRGEAHKLYPVKNKHGHIASIMHYDVQRCTVLPITAWTRDKLGRRFYLNVPPPPPYLLLNNYELIKSHPTTVFLTDAIDVAMHNYAPGGASFKDFCLWASWLGGKAVVDKVDWSPLKGKSVCYVIFCGADSTLERSYDVALSVYKIIRTIKDVKIGFCECRVNACVPDATFLTNDEFERKAKALLNIADTSEPTYPISLREMLAKGGGARKFVLEPFMHERSTTLMYSATSVGKTWLALCLGYTVATHGSLFQGRWQAKEAGGVLYIDSEMDEMSLRNRLRIVTRMRFDGKRPRVVGLSPRFFCMPMNRGSFEDQAFKDRIAAFTREKNISLVVLDNLSSFTRHNDSAKAWEDIHAWVDRLKAGGCAVLVLHHSNKAGQQRGTSATTNAVDNVIRLEKEDSHGYSSVFHVKVYVEKGRDIHGDSKRSFKLRISPMSAQPHCDFVSFLDHPNAAKSEGCSRLGHEVSVAPGETLRSDAISDPAAERTRRCRRTPQARAALEAMIHNMLRGGKTVLDIAKEIPVSISTIYQLGGDDAQAAFAEMRSIRGESKRKRDEEIWRLYGEKIPLPLILQRMPPQDGFRFTITSVRRVIDRKLEEIVKPFLDRGDSPEEIAQEARLEVSVVERLAHHVNLKRVPDLVEAGKDAATISRMLGLPEMQVEKAISMLKLKVEEKNARADELGKAGRMIEGGAGFEKVVSDVNLPPLTIKRLLNAHRKNVGSRHGS